MKPNYYSRQIEVAKINREITNRNLLKTFKECLTISDNAHKNIGDVWDYLDPYNPEVGFIWRKNK